MADKPNIHEEISDQEIDEISQNFLASLIKENHPGQFHTNLSEKGDLLPAEVTTMLVTYFTDLSRDLSREADDLFEFDDEESSSVSSIQPTEKQCQPYLSNPNPFVRLKIASFGYFGEVLKHDSIPEIRLEVLRRTGVYSEFFKDREDDLLVIQEMLRQGHEVSYFKGLTHSSEIQKLVEYSEQYHHILRQISSMSEESLDLLGLISSSLENLYLTTQDESLKDDILEAGRYIKFDQYNRLKNFTEKTDKQLESERLRETVIDDTIKIVSKNPETPVGHVVSYSKDKMTITLVGESGEEFDMSTLDMSQCLLDQAELNEAAASEGLLSEKSSTDR